MYARKTSTRDLRVQRRLIQVQVLPRSMVHLNIEFKFFHLQTLGPNYWGQILLSMMRLLISVHWCSLSGLTCLVREREHHDAQKRTKKFRPREEGELERTIFFFITSEGYRIKYLLLQERTDIENAQSENRD